MTRAHDPSPPNSSADRQRPGALPWRWLGVAATAVLALLLALSAGFFVEGCTPAGAIVIGIVVLAAGLWALEPIDPAATALLVIGLLVLLVGLPLEIWPNWGRERGFVAWQAFVEPAGSSIMVLLLGSLMMSAGAARTGLDLLAGRALIRAARGRPGRLVAALLLGSAFVSLWTSNTATAAVMIAMTRPIWSRGPVGLAPAAVLAILLGANVGGFASPVGTPPSTLVFIGLAQAGFPIPFHEWLLRGLPLAAAPLLAGWFMIRRVAPWPEVSLDGLMPANSPQADTPRWRVHVTIAVILLTILLWVTSAWTGVPVGAAALVPIALLPACGVLGPRDLRALEWDVLLLILGGLALGEAMQLTGLGTLAVGALPIDALPPTALVLATAAVAMALSVFMSNTAVANLLWPIVATLTVSICAARGLDGRASASLMISAGFAVAMGAGIAMPLPVSTPANALGARTGVIRTGQLLAVAAAVAVAGLVALGVATTLGPPLGW